AVAAADGDEIDASVQKRPDDVGRIALARRRRIDELESPPPLAVDQRAHLLAPVALARDGVVDEKAPFDDGDRGAAVAGGAAFLPHRGSRSLGHPPPRPN